MGISRRSVYNCAFAGILALYLGNFIGTEIFRVCVFLRSRELSEIKMYPFTSWGLYAVLPTNGKKYFRVRLTTLPDSTRDGEMDFNSFVYHYKYFPPGFLHDRIQRYIVSGHDDQLKEMLQFLISEWSNSHAAKLSQDSVKVNIHFVCMEAKGELQCLLAEDRDVTCNVSIATRSGK